jgi:hypothetical protein
MTDVRKILVIFLIGILYAVFVQSAIEALHPAPKYEDFCRQDYSYPASPVKMAEPENCTPLPTLQCDKGGNVQYNYSGGFCPTSSYCDYCNVDLEKAQQEHRLIVFIVSSIMALIAIAVGLMLPVHKKPINEYIGTGFLLGGLITLFFGTIVYYSDMTRIIRPIVMLLELALVIFLAYKKLKK